MQKRAEDIEFYVEEIFNKAERNFLNKSFLRKCLELFAQSERQRIIDEILNQLDDKELFDKEILNDKINQIINK